MNQMSNEYFPDEGEIESRAMLRALSIVQVIADPAGATARMKSLTKATAEHNAARTAAENLMAEADHKMAAAEAASTSLAQRTTEYQTWVDATEKAYRAREDRVRTNEESQAAREAKLAAAEADLERRVAAHQEQVRQMRAHLGAVA
jgi:hypothetical protein